jgi:hypothetical protein
MIRIPRPLVRGVVALGSAVAVFGATAAAVELTGDQASPPVSAAAGASPEVQTYWSDTKQALSPLLLYVRILPATITALDTSRGQLRAGQIRQAEEMAESFATARDLVGRLPVPASVAGDVSELLQLACQLYRESALTLTELPATAVASQLHRAEALHTLGDRLIDQSRRVLAIDAAQPGGAAMELQYAPAVPALADIAGIAPAADLSRAAAALEATGSGTAEDLIGARLAILLGVLAEEAQAAGQHRSARALTFLSVDLRSTARTLSARPHSSLAGPDVRAGERAQIWTGGAFDGHPPALRPGEDIGAGLPGGLPTVDPVAILRG